MKIYQWSQSMNYHREMLRFRLFADFGVSASRIHQLMPLVTNDTFPVTLSIEDLQYPPALAAGNIQEEDDNLHTEITYLNSLRTKLGIQTPTRSIDEDALQTPFQITEQWDPSIDLYGMEPTSSVFIATALATGSNNPVLSALIGSRYLAPQQWVYVSIDDASGKVSGASLPGIPGVMIGRTDSFSWAYSASMADVQDVYVQVENDAGQYKHNGQYHDYDVTTETIKVKGQADTTLTVKNSVNGPVLNGAISGVPGNFSLALKWTALQYNNDTSILGFWNLWHSTSYQEFLNAAGQIKYPAINIAYGNTDGDTAIIHAGLFPLRDTTVGHTGLFPVEGDGTRDWVGYSPSTISRKFSQGVGSYYVISNNRPFERGYQYNPSYDYATTYRFSRIYNYMAERVNVRNLTFNADQMFAMITDPTSDFFEQWRPLVVDNADMTGPGEDYVKSLRDWGGYYFRGSAEPYMFESWMWELSKLPAQETGMYWFDHNYLVNTFITANSDKACSNRGVSCAEYAASAISAAQTKFGSHTWGTSANQADFVNPALTSYTWRCVCTRVRPTDGGPFTMVFSGYDDFRNNYRGTYGATFKMITDMSSAGTLEKAVFSMPMGNSGNVFYDYQYDQWNGPFFNLDFMKMTIDTYKSSSSQKISA